MSISFASHPLERSKQHIYGSISQVPTRLRCFLTIPLCMLWYFILDMTGLYLNKGGIFKSEFVSATTRFWYQVRAYFTFPGSLCMEELALFFLLRTVGSICVAPRATCWMRTEDDGKLTSMMRRIMQMVCLLLQSLLGQREGGW